MKIRYLKKTKRFKPTVLAMGVFDGVHLGHLKILNETKRIAHRFGLTSSVLTFSPHPLETLKVKTVPPLLISLEQRLKILKKIGIDQVIIAKFTKNFSRKKPYDFIKELVLKKLNTKWIIVGSDYRFGRGGVGDKNLLKILSVKFKFKVIFIKPLVLEKRKVSSSLIRKLISEGRLIEASKYLGRHYNLAGKVVKGRCCGKLLGFATANLSVTPQLLLKGGVYVGWVLMGDKRKGAVINIGKRPTFGRKSKTIEVHIFGFNKNIYGKKIEVFFVRKLRKERKFKNKNELIQQIKKDVQKAKKILKKADKLLGR